MDTEAAQMFKARYRFVWFCDWSFWTSSGLSVSILAPFFISSADGTLMMSLVSGAAGGGGSEAFVSSSSTSKIRVEFGGMPRFPRSP